MPESIKPAQETPKPGEENAKQMTGIQYHDAAVTSWDAYEKEQDPDKKTEILKTVRENTTKAKEAYAKEGEATAQATKEKEAKAKPPEKYELKLPEKSPLSQADIDKVSAIAKEKGLSNDVAQTLLEQRSQAVAEFAAGQLTQLETKKTEWLETAKTDKEYGGEAFNKNAEIASRVIARFGSEALKKDLNESGLGNHPELVRMMVKIGKEFSEDQLVLPGASTTSKEKKSIADRLYA